MSILDVQCGDRRTRLRHNHLFRLLWAASTAGYLAGWVVKFALPLVATHVTRSPLLVSSVTTFVMAPWLVLGLPVGALVDRLDRRRTLLLAMALRGATAGLLALAVVAGVASMPLLYGTAFLLGIADTLAETAATAILPMLVPHTHLERANTHLIGVQQVIEAVSLPLGGALAAAGLAFALGAGGACYGIGLIALLFLRGAFRPLVRTRQHLVTDVLEGVRFLWNHQALRTLGIMAGVINACWTAWLAVLVLYAVAPGPLRLTAFQYGVLLTASGIGGVVGAALTDLVQRTLGRRWAIGLNICTNTIMFLAPGLTANAWAIAVAIFIGGVGGPMWTIAATALQQRVVPLALQGRVSAAYRLLGLGAEAIGPMVGGIIAQVLGIQAVFMSAALLTALMLLPFLRIVSEEVM